MFNNILWFIAGFISCFVFLAVGGKLLKRKGPNSIIKTKETVSAVKKQETKEDAH